MSSNTVLSLLNLNPRKFGSIEEYLVHLSSALRDRGCNSVIAFPKPASEELQKQFAGAGAVLEDFPLAPAASLYSNLFRLIRKHKPKVVHFHFFDHFSFLPLLGAISGPTQVIFTDHCRLPQQRQLTRLKCKIWDTFLLGPLGTQVVGVSEHVKRTLVDCYGTAPQHIKVVLNGVNLQRFGSQRKNRNSVLEEFGIPENKKLVVAAGYFIPEKGLGDLLVAAASVRASHSDVAFLLVGDGPLDAALRQQKSDLGLNDTVFFAGLRSDVNRLMGVADVVVVPSVWQEPAGLVVVEAMASGSPVVATRMGGIPEYLEDQQTGFLVEPHNPSQIAEALLRLLESPALASAIGTAGRTRTEAHFSMTRWVDETLKLYESLSFKAAAKETSLAQSVR